MIQTERVWLTITGEQTAEDGHRDRNSTRCLATYQRDGDTHRLSYTERFEGGDQVDSVLTIAPEEVRIERTGSLGTRMLFVRDQETDCMYQTAFGCIPMMISTSMISILETSERLHARVKYRLLFGEAGGIDSAVTIKVEPAG